MRIGFSQRPHLMKNDGNFFTRDLPSRFRARKTTTDDVNGFDRHGADHSRHAKLEQDQAYKNENARREGVAGVSFGSGKKGKSQEPKIRHIVIGGGDDARRNF